MREYFIDTNIMMYSGGKESEYKEDCLKIREKIEKKKIIIYNDTEIIQEILYRFYNLNLAEDRLELSWDFLQLKPKEEKTVLKKSANF